MQKIASLFVSLCLLALLGQVNMANGETVGERFDKALKEIAKQCASRKLEPNEVCGGVAKLKPADPLATEEGRFAHSIKIPNPVPEDSGYKPGMTPEQYFDYLCKTEAGEFIYKTVENVEGIIQLRPRVKANYEYSHLYAFEDPFGFDADPAFFVYPGWYTYYETIVSSPMGQGPKYMRYFGYDGRSLETLRKVNEAQRKSRYGYTWRGIVRPLDRENGIGGGEVILVDLETNEVLAVHRGYAQFKMDERVGLIKAGWRNRCPSIQATGGPYGHFILKVLKPGSTSLPAEGGHNATK
jgi:hypothetical protein